jgi:hypothetical protein
MAIPTKVALGLVALSVLTGTSTLAPIFLGVAVLGWILSWMTVAHASDGHQAGIRLGAIGAGAVIALVSALVAIGDDRGWYIAMLGIGALFTAAVFAVAWMVARLVRSHPSV